MQHFMGPYKTPPIIKGMIWVIVIISLLYPILTYFILETYKIAAPAFWLPLSLPGIRQGYLWQLVTYFFIHSVGTGFSILFLISLFFHMFLFWFAGSEVASRYYTWRFLLFYFGAGIFSGLVVLLYFFLFQPAGILFGSGPPVYALLTVWGMLYPELELYMFFLLRVSAKWIVLLFLAISLLFNIFAGDFSHFVGDLAGIIWGFAIGRFVWKLPNPYWGKFH